MLYEYAGFQFEVIPTELGVKLVAQPGQHKAAYKEKHARNALQCYLEDIKNGR